MVTRCRCTECRKRFVASPRAGKEQCTCSDACRVLRRLRRERYEVHGVVQGVGFRPFVYRLAMEEGLAGFIGNDSGGVTIEVEGRADRIDSFRRRLEAEAPPLSRIDSAIAIAARPRARPAFVLSQARPAARLHRHSRRCGDVLRLPARAARSERSPISLSISELHQLRPALHDHAPHSLRPPADLNGEFQDVPGLPGGVRRSHQPPLSRAAQRLPRLRPARLARNA